MKNFFEKHDLIKIAGIMVLLTCILTWIIPYGYYTGTEMVINDISRISITNFLQYGMLGMYYFTVLITFLFVLGGFYQVLSKSISYQNLVKAISRAFKTRETILVLAVSFIIALLTSVSTEYFPILVFIPFIITVMNKTKIDKITAFLSTFGAMLVGALGSTYNTNIAEVINNAFSTTATTAIGYKIALFVMGYGLLNIIAIKRIQNKKQKDEEDYDKFKVETLKSVRPDIKIWPYATILGALFLVTVLAYLPWEAWGVTLWTKTTTSITEFELFGVPILKYFFDPIMAFGKWDIYTIQFVLLLATLIIKWIEHISFDEILESYGQGFKRMGSTVIILLAVYLVLEIAVVYPTVPYLVDKIANWSNSFNALWSSLSAFVASIFGVEMRYVVSLSGTYLATEYSEFTKTLALIYQAIYGFVGFFAPTSAILMLGLSYLKISYFEWIKNIWKFLIAILVTIIALICLMSFKITSTEVLIILAGIILLAAVAYILLTKTNILKKNKKTKKRKK